MILASHKNKKKKQKQSINLTLIDSQLWFLNTNRFMKLNLNKTKNIKIFPLFLWINLQAEESRCSGTKTCQINKIHKEFKCEHFVCLIKKD